MAPLTIINFRGRDSGCSLLILFYIIVLPAFIITLQAQVCSAVNPNLYCSNNSYSVGSDFESNLNTVFKSLVQNTSQTGYNTSVYGQSPDRVYGLLQCRGDATVDQCNNCSRNTTTSVRQSQNCGNAIGGRIWLDSCFLRYENYNFIGGLDLKGYYNFYLYNASDPDVFNAARDKLLSDLSAEAAYGSSRNRYASGTTAGSFFPKIIYALVQCTKDIVIHDCTTCLAKGASDIKEYYSGCSGVEYFMGSCIVSYAIDPFFNSPSPVEAPVADTPRSPPVAEAPANTPRSPPVAEAPANTPVLTQSKKIPTILGIVGGLFLALLVCMLTTRRRLKSAIFRRGYEVHEQIEEGTPVSEDRQIVTFKLETLVAATNNFHNDNKLGEGGFGSVYKGTTQDGKEIAVKTLSLNSMQGTKEFMTEVNLVAKIHHRNLVKLLGCCAEGSRKLLVYQYLQHGSLDKILFDPIKRGEFDWQKRYNVILGVARGLLYLHEDAQPRIIHRDIKASNILLDEKLNPKIADFGLAKFFHDGQTHISTRVAGTYGYMAPEYAMQGQLTTKADVYSFGVLLLELITGRKNMDLNVSPEMQILLGWVWRSYKTGNSVEIIDPAIIETCDEKQALRCIHVGLLCTETDSSLRPEMFVVTQMLSSHSMMLPDPTKPVFANSVNRIHTQPGSSRSGLSEASKTTSSASGLSQASKTTSSTSSHQAHAPPSNVFDSITELVPM